MLTNKKHVIVHHIRQDALLINQNKYKKND